ncbi:hypothetical protein [Hyphomicrobium sp.]|uniref:hypothetical protein n=1 Tax=Hyphomicrobium sp. TaxID=82 RepID=UPI000F97E0DD|nr:hypothetical protein [Hyphomicrobium sp.]RUO99281.1 MAG: hypothetical protein EKK30_08635 [Hyphomicrobium sp.]
MARIETSEQARAATHDFTDKAVDAGIRAVDSLERSAASAQEMGDRLISKSSELSDNVQKVAKNFSAALDKSVADQPLTTLGMAIAAGFVLGAIWKA